MAKYFTGVQSTGTPHLGNLLGAIIPAIALSNKPENESFLFIADLHSDNADQKTVKPYEPIPTALPLIGLWLRCKVVFYRQSDVPQQNCHGI
jgi:tryptophanyl-tRNA synthetase